MLAFRLNAAISAQIMKKNLLVISSPLHNGEEREREEKRQNRCVIQIEFKYKRLDKSWIK